jgi:hypothetical protein
MKTIVYLLSGPAHLPYLATSLLSLRRHWTGTVKVFAWAESFEIAKAIAEDERIQAEPVASVPTYRGKNDQFISKIRLMQEQESGPNLYLDADTLVAGPLDEMFSAAECYGMAVTQFCNWTTAGNLIRGRIERLREFKTINGRWIDEVTTAIYPSVNGGVFCCMPNNLVLDVWHKWSFDAKSIFICDECVLHLMVPMFAPQERLVVMPGRFNSSPKYVKTEPKYSQVRVWHGHGDCWVRPQKSPEGWEMWSAALKECRQLNVGQINEWLPLCGNKYLNLLLEDPNEAVKV